MLSFAFKPKKNTTKPSCEQNNLRVLLLSGSTGESLNALLKMIACGIKKDNLLDHTDNIIRPIWYKIYQSKKKLHFNAANLNSGDILLLLPDNLNDLIHLSEQLQCIPMDSYRILTLLPNDLTPLNLLHYLDSIQSQQLIDTLPFPHSKYQMTAMMNQYLIKPCPAITQEQIRNWLKKSKETLSMWPSALQAIISDYSFSIQDIMGSTIPQCL